MEWIDIWIKDPHRNEEILFMTGDEEIHLGEIFSQEKLRKCKFYSYVRKCDYECDLKTPYEERVIYWFPLPKQPERSKREDFDEFCKNKIDELLPLCQKQWESCPIDVKFNKDSV